MIQKSGGRRAYRRALPLALTVVMGSAALLAGAAPAEAASCGSQSVTNADDGYIVLAHDANLQKAPYGACGTYALGKANTKIWLWCAVENDYGNTWYWGRIDKTETYGWVYLGDAKEVEEKPTANDGWCPGEAPADPDAIDGADRVVEVTPAPEPEDSLPVEEFDAATDVDAALPPIAGAEDGTAPADDWTSNDGPEAGFVSSTQAVTAAASTMRYGAPIKRAKVIARAKDWYKRNVQYSHRDADKAWDVNHGRKYRTDCSGFVSMAWALNAEPDTRHLDSYGVRINWSSLKPGDMILRDGHVQLFEKWANKSHTSFWLFEEGQPSSDMNHYKLKVSSAKQGHFKPYRYKRIRD